MKLERIMEFKQTSLFSTEAEDDLVNDLAKKFPRIPRGRIQWTLQNVKNFLKKETGGNYSHKQLKDWVDSALRKDKKSESVKNLRSCFRKPVSQVIDYKSAAANDKTWDEK